MSRRCLFFLLPLAALILMGCPIGPAVPIADIRIVLPDSSDPGTMIDVQEITIYEGQVVLLGIVIEPSEAGSNPVIWSSSDPSCVPVTQTGMVSGESLGDQVVISAESAANGVFDTILIDVDPTKLPPKS